tara:strand:- start:573 stop:752 length:180 start_codon:yes stop_codon:yes gene_type:complete
MSNGFTNKEMLQLILQNQTEMREEIKEIKQELSKKVSRTEVVGWIVACSSIVGLVGMNI